MARTQSGRYGDDYARYIEEELGIRLWAKQKQIIEAVRQHRRVAVKAGFGVGKTYGAAGLAIAYYECHPESKVITTAAKMAQVRHQMWANIRRLDKSGLPPLVTMKVDPENPMHIMLGQTSATPEAFRGSHAERQLIIIDEASGADRVIWEAVDSMAVGEDNRVLAIGNPTQPTGPFADAFTNGRWHPITISVMEHPNILAGLAGEPPPYPGAVSLLWLHEKLGDADYCTRLGQPEDDTERDRWLTAGAFQFPPETGEWYEPSPRGEIEILGKFPSKAIDSIWSAAWLTAARERRTEILTGGLIEIGVDPARFGDDSTAFHARTGPASVMHKSWRKADTNETVGRIMQSLDELGRELKPERIHIRIDSSGGDLGAGIYDTLRERFAGSAGVTIEEIAAGGRALDSERYPNRRSELWFAAAGRGRDGDLDLSRLDSADYDRLVVQLTAPKYKPDSRGRDVVEPKDETKKRIGRSPDDADAFNLAYAGSVHAQMTAADMARLNMPSRWSPASGTRDIGAPEGWGAGRIERGRFGGKRR